VDVDAGLRTPRRSHANPRLCRKPRGGHGCIRQELAAGVKKSPGRNEFGAAMRPGLGLGCTFKQIGAYVPDPVSTTARL
jgi:hypothetical protein